MLWDRYFPHRWIAFALLYLRHATRFSVGLFGNAHLSMVGYGRRTRTRSPHLGKKLDDRRNDPARNVNARNTWSIHDGCGRDIGPRSNLVAIGADRDQLLELTDLGGVFQDPFRHPQAHSHGIAIERLG
jgi:hypothetical protein